MFIPLLFFLFDFLLAGLLHTFLLSTVRWLYYWYVLKKQVSHTIVFTGLLVLLESFFMYGMFGLDLIVMVPLTGLLRGTKDTFNNHWVLSAVLVSVCYIIHAGVLYILTYIYK